MTKKQQEDFEKKIHTMILEGVGNMFAGYQKKNEENHQRLETKMDIGFTKLDHKIDNLAANTPTVQRVEALKRKFN